MFGFDALKCVSAVFLACTFHESLISWQMKNLLQNFLEKRLFVMSYWSLSSEYAAVEVSFGLWERKWNLRFWRTFAGIKDFTRHLSEGSLLARLYIGAL